jgi:hypothetical protein
MQRLMMNGFQLWGWAMLDFGKLLPQFDNITSGNLMEETADKVNLAQDVLLDAIQHIDGFHQKLIDSQGQTFWSLAMPLETIDTKIPLIPSGQPCTVVAVDGSQIMPSHHEVHSCYLINIGKAIISYGEQHPVILDSLPYLFHSPEDLYPLVDRRRFHVDDMFVSLERNLLELSTLRDCALEATNRALPVVALLDGSLIPWSLDNMPEAYQRRYSQRMQFILQSFHDNNIPLLGYISHSRSSDVINTLRVWRCPYPQSDCHRLCGQLTEDDYPCSVFWPITDRQLMHQTLKRFFRGPLFASGTKKASGLPREHGVCFTHVNTGKEIARIEFPRWLADDVALLHAAIETTVAQAEKGPGYPVSLAEAHNLAVVRAADRKRFFELLANHLIELGVPRVRISPKESGKRRGIV